MITKNVQYTLLYFYLQVLQKLSKEEIWNKYQKEIVQLSKENEGS